MPGVQFDPGAVLDKVMMVTMVMMWMVIKMTMSMTAIMMTMLMVLDNVDGDHDDNVDDDGGCDWDDNVAVKGDLCWGGRRRLLSLPIGRLQVTTSILNIIIIYHHHHHHCNLWGVFLCLASHLLHSANL